MRPSRLTSLCIAYLLCACATQGSTGTLETKIKAAYLYNFSKFVDWPQNGQKMVKICVLGDAGINKMLEDLAAKQGDKKEFAAHSITKSEVDSCDILYIAGSQSEIKNILALTKERDILTVGDSDHFNEQGGMITLFSDNGKIRFSINVAATKKTNLKISSKLLELAKIK